MKCYKQNAFISLRSVYDNLRFAFNGSELFECELLYNNCIAWQDV